MKLPTNPSMTEWSSLSKLCLTCIKKVTAKDDGELKRFRRLIDSTDSEIDRLVYDLYGLTEEEIRIVEK